MRDLAITILERLSPNMKDYHFVMEAEKWGITPKDWLEAVKWLVKKGYAEAHNVNRDVVAVRQTLSEYPILYYDANEKVMMRPVLGNEIFPPWMPNLKSDKHKVALVDQQELEVITTAAIVGHTRYEDMWLMETLPIRAEV